MTYREILKLLKENSDSKALEGMARFGITPQKAYGVRMPVLREIAKKAGRDEKLSIELWKNKSRETMFLACLTYPPELLTEEMMESWVLEFDYWEAVDQGCMNLFEKSPLAWKKAYEWSDREEEWVKRAGFVLMARLAVSDKKADDCEFEKFLPIIEREAHDRRNGVKKAVNWALRQIGKRNLALREKAVQSGQRIKERGEGASRWVAGDALRELESEAVIKRLEEKEKRKKNKQK